MSAVHTAAARPYWESLAIEMASSTESNVMTDRTGPKSLPGDSHRIADAIENGLHIRPAVSEERVRHR
jgi:hypothetical protein